eukprot:scaffold64145_cov61-Cyclotella_meneghiniana.AAC.6
MGIIIELSPMRIGLGVGVKVVLDLRFNGGGVSVVGVSDGTADVVGVLLGRREGCDEGFADGFELGAIETVGLNDGLVDGAVDKLGSAVGLSDGVIVGIVVVGSGVGFDGSFANNFDLVQSHYA